MSILDDIGSVVEQDFKDALVFARAKDPRVNAVYSAMNLFPDTDPTQRSFTDNLASVGNTVFNAATLVPGVGPAIKGAKLASAGMKAGKMARTYRATAKGYQAAGPKIARAGEKYIRPYTHLAREELAQGVSRSGRVNKLDKWQGKKYALISGRRRLKGRALQLAPPSVRYGTESGRIAAKVHKQNAMNVIKNGRVYPSIPSQLNRTGLEYSKKAVMYKKKAKKKFAKAMIAPTIGQFFGPE